MTIFDKITIISGIILYHNLPLGKNSERMSSKYAEIYEALHPERHYVPEIGKKLGIDMELVRHPRATDTCHEKADLLNETQREKLWTPDRVVKAVYLKICLNGDKINKFFGFVFPELDKRIHRKDIRRMFDETGVTTYDEKKQSFPSMTSIVRGMDNNGIYPANMEYGTCPPFPLESSMENEIEKIFIHGMKYKGSDVIDVSIGGEGEDYHTLSLQMPYHGMGDILTYAFGDKVKEVDIFAANF